MNHSVGHIVRLSTAALSSFVCVYFVTVVEIRQRYSLLIFFECQCDLG